MRLYNKKLSLSTYFFTNMRFFIWIFQFFPIRVRHMSAKSELFRGCTTNIPKFPSVVFLFFGHFSEWRENKQHLLLLPLSGCKSKPLLCFRKIQPKCLFPQKSHAVPFHIRFQCLPYAPLGIPNGRLHRFLTVITVNDRSARFFVLHILTPFSTF